MMHFIFCLPGIQVRLVNLPRGENIRDARITRSLQSWLESYLPNGYNADFVYLHNRISVDINFEDQADNDVNDENDLASAGVDPSPRVSGHSGAERVETSDVPVCDHDPANNSGQNGAVNAADSEVERLRTPRRRMKKRSRKCAVQPGDSSSENEKQPRPSKRRRRQKSRAKTRCSSRETGQSGTRKELAGGKRKSRIRSGKADKSQDCEEDPGRKENKGPVQRGSSFPKSPIEGIDPGPSRQSTRQNGNKRKRVTSHDKHPVDEESSSEECAPTGRRKRHRKEKKEPAEDDDSE